MNKLVTPVSLCCVAHQCSMCSKMSPQKMPGAHSESNGEQQKFASCLRIVPLLHSSAIGFEPHSCTIHSTYFLRKRARLPIFYGHRVRRNFPYFCRMLRHRNVISVLAVRSMCVVQVSVSQLIRMQVNRNAASKHQVERCIWQLKNQSVCRPPNMAMMKSSAATIYQSRKLYASTRRFYRNNSLPLVSIDIYAICCGVFVAQVSSSSCTLLFVWRRFVMRYSH